MFNNMTGQNHVFRISGNGVDLEPLKVFSINPNTGVVYAHRPIDRELHEKHFHVSKYWITNHFEDKYISYRFLTIRNNFIFEPLSTDHVWHPWQIEHASIGQGTSFWCRNTRHQWQRTYICQPSNDSRCERKYRRGWVDGPVNDLLEYAYFLPAVTEYHISNK